MFHTCRFNAKHRLWEVGCYKPGREFRVLEEFGSFFEASKWVSHLNGGPRPEGRTSDEREYVDEMRADHGTEVL